jgi:hypothetical protein
MRNRVTPAGDIATIEQRGACWAIAASCAKAADVVRFHRSDLWTIRRLQYRGCRLPQWMPGRYTVLHFAASG